MPFFQVNGNGIGQRARHENSDHLPRVAALRYRDSDPAISRLAEAFGAEPADVHRDAQGRVAHAELKLGDKLITLGTFDDKGFLGGDQLNSRARTISLYVAIADPDVAHERAVAAGADITRNLSDTEYGSREFSVQDHEADTRSFGTYNPHDC